MTCDIWRLQRLEHLTARAFWESAEYQDIKKLREGICDVEVVLVEAPPIGTGN